MSLPQSSTPRRGRPPKYASEAERLEARRAQARAWRERNADHLRAKAARDREERPAGEQPRRRGRPPKYATEDERREARRAQHRAWRERNADKLRAETERERERVAWLAAHAPEQLEREREAARERDRARYAERADEIRAAARRRRAERLASADGETHRERERAAQRAWQRANADYIRERDRAYRAEHGSRIRERRRAHYRRDPDARTRARQYRLARTWSVELPDEVAYAYLSAIAADPCTYCGRPGEENDHVVPLSGRRLAPGAERGTNDWWNFARACRRCNSSKNDWPLATYLARAHDDRARSDGTAAANAWYERMRARFAWELQQPGCKDGRAHGGPTE